MRSRGHFLPPSDVDAEVVRRGIAIRLRLSHCRGACRLKFNFWLYFERSQSKTPLFFATPYPRVACCCSRCGGRLPHRLLLAIVHVSRSHNRRRICDLVASLPTAKRRNLLSCSSVALPQAPELDELDVVRRPFSRFAIRLSWLAWLDSATEEAPAAEPVSVPTGLVPLNTH